MKANHVLVYGIAVSVASVVYAAFTLNWTSTFFIGLGIFFYVIIYTVWLKRNNSSNIVIGGFAGSAASMAGWTAATGFVPPYGIDLLGFLVGFLVFVWTPSHFWCLAMKIRDDYAEAKVPMLPVLIGMHKTSKYILANTAILLPYSLALSFIPNGLGIVYFVIAAASGGLMLVYHYKLTKNPTSDFAWKAYKVTAPYLTIIFVAVALDAAFHFRF
jgi:protoheme IX farnesyltransferase